MDLFFVASEATMLWTATRLILLVAFILLLHCLRLVITRLYFSPIAKFPGPRLAAISYWYEGYYDLLSQGGGQFAFQLKRLHGIYGPIVRISPDELHIDDPDYYSEIFCNSHPSRPIDKTDLFKYRLNIAESIVSTVSAEDHRLRRAAVAPFFSKARTRGYNVELQRIADRISHRLSTEYSGTGRVVHVTHMWSSFTGDMIRKLAFGLPITFCDAPGFVSPFPAAMASFIHLAHYSTHFRFLGSIIESVPDSILLFLLPAARGIIEYRQVMLYHDQFSFKISNLIQELRRQIKVILASHKSDEHKASDHPTIFHEILASGLLPPKDLSFDRLTQEAMLLNGAGIETTSWSLTIATFYILSNPSIENRLKEELMSAVPNPAEILPWGALEQLPYLSAIVNEGTLVRDEPNLVAHMQSSHFRPALRLSFGSVQRLPRVNRLATWVYKDYEIPPNTPVSMDAYHTHTDERIFPDPLEFRPERWLGDPMGPDGIHPLSHYLVSFSRGARGCLGMDLAVMEVYVGLATIFRRHNMRLFETTRADVDFAIDLVKPVPKRGSKGVRVTIT
ncbi:cytochrome P450 [Apiospora saccharicola]|uniref:Cytochrome P450 n=1 Tax=Apiospora saccharicola TaxID=335842 RepID=A0ABR1TPT4_9PEZI